MQEAYRTFFEHFIMEEAGLYDTNHEVELGQCLQNICEQYLTEIDNGQLYTQIILTKYFVSN
jgi:hypothetical protein